MLTFLPRFSLFAVAIALVPSIASAGYDADTISLRIVPEATSTASLEDGKVYAVEITCRPGKYKIRRSLSSGFFGQTSVTASEFIYIGSEVPAKSPDGTAQLPATAFAFVPVFSVDKASRILNTNCSKIFFVPGGQQLYLIAGINYNTKHEASILSKLLWAALNAVSPVHTLLYSKPLNDDVATKLGDLNAAKEPINQIFSALDDGDSYTEARNINPGTYEVITNYTIVKIVVRPVESLVLDKNTSFRTAFRKQVSSAEKLDPTKIPTTCLQVAGALGSLGFTSKVDLAYATYVLATRAGFQASQIIKCLGREYAYTAVDYKHLFFLPGAPEAFKFTRADIDTVAPPPDALFAAQPAFKDKARDIGNLIDYWAIYARNEPSGRTKAALDKLSELTNDKITVVDTTFDNVTQLDDKPHDRIDIFDKLKSSGFIRVGCYYETVNELNPERDGSPVAILAFKATNADTRVAFDKAIVIRPLYENNKISRLGIFKNSGWQKFILEKHSYLCGEGLTVDKPPDKAPDKAPASPAP